MKTRILASTLLAASLAVSASSSALASDEFAAAVVVGGTGAVLGHAIGGSDGAIIGGFLGALLGAAAADDNDHGRYYTDHRHYQRVRPPVYVVAPPPRYGWRNEWRHEHDGRWDRGGWHDNNRRSDGQDRWGDRNDRRGDRRGH